jgi:DHA1 family tetracycline resistance protein-like MFS transporter
MTTASDKNIKRLLGIIALDQTYIQFSLPIVTLIFFDSASRLLPPDTSNAVRSMWFGTCISIPYFINLFFAPLLSTLSDEFGRRKFLLLEIISAFLYTLLAGFGIVFGQLWLLIVGFVIRGAFSRTNTTALAMIGDACEKNRKMAFMGYLQVAISIGACIGPILSGYFAKSFFFDTLNFSLPFFISAILALINSVLTYYLIGETLQQKTSDTVQASNMTRLSANLQSIKHVITHPDILRASLLLLLFQFSWSIYYQFMPALLKTVYQFDAHQLGLFVGMIAFWLLVGSGPTFRILRKNWNSHQLLNISACLVLAGIAIPVAVYFHYLPDFFFWISSIPTAIGDVLAYICLTTLFSNVVADHMQGKVMGVNFLITGLVWSACGFFGGVLIGHSPILPFLIAPLGVICSLFAINAHYGKKMVLSYSY